MSTGAKQNCGARTERATTRRTVLRLFGAMVGGTMWAARAAAPPRVTFVASAFGALPDGSDAGPGLARLASTVAGSKGGRIIIPPGRYRVVANSGVAFRLAGLSDVEIEADGVEVRFSGLIRPLQFVNCRGLRLRGLGIGWARPPFSQGDVANVSADGKTAEVALDEITPMDGWSRVDAIGGYDRPTGLMSRQRVDAYNAVETVEPLGPRRARLKLKWPVGIERAKTVVLRHAVYDSHAVEFHDCSDVVVENVAIHAAPGMAFLGVRCDNISLNECVVAPEAGSGLMMSTCADAAHFGDCRGDIVVDNCRFARMGDDGLNVTSSYWRIADRPDGRSIMATKWRDNPFQPDEIPPPGERFEFASSSTLERIGEGDVAGAIPLSAAPATQEKLRFLRDLPAGTSVGDVVIDETRTPRVTVRQCRFDGNRARGVLVHQNAAIENCEFFGQSAQAIILAPDLFWMEGPEAANVRIVGNTFDGVDRWGLKLGAITVDATVIGPDGKPRPSPGHPNHDIDIRDNVYRNFDGPPVVMRAYR